MDFEIKVLIPTSPIPSHPSTTLLEKAIASVKQQLPTAEIIILMDGVRPSVEFRRHQYEAYKQAVKSLGLPKVTWIEFQVPTQQAMMVKKALSQMPDQVFMFLEHDAVLDARFIDWAAILSILQKDANVVRLYWHKDLHPEHLYLMQGRLAPEFEKTIQFSGWPFLSRTRWFEHLIDRHFSAGQQAMLETVLYSPFTTEPWESNCMVIYTPAGRDYITFHHLNGRIGDDGQKDPGEW